MALISFDYDVRQSGHIRIILKIIVIPTNFAWDVCQNIKPLSIIIITFNSLSTNEHKIYFTALLCSPQLNTACSASPPLRSGLHQHWVHQWRGTSQGNVPWCSSHSCWRGQGVCIFEVPFGLQCFATWASPWAITPLFGGQCFVTWAAPWAITPLYMGDNALQPGPPLGKLPHSSGDRASKFLILTLGSSTVNLLDHWILFLF